MRIVLEGAEGIADGQHPFADFQVVGLAQAGFGQGGALDLQHRDIDIGVGVDQLGGNLASVGQRDGNRRCAFDDVVIGHDIAVGTDHQSAAQRRNLLLIFPVRQEAIEEIVEIRIGGPHDLRDDGADGDDRGRDALDGAHDRRDAFARSEQSRGARGGGWIEPGEGGGRRRRRSAGSVRPSFPGQRDKRDQADIGGGQAANQPTSGAIHFQWPFSSATFTNIAIISGRRALFERFIPPPACEIPARRRSSHPPRPRSGAGEPCNP
ncbi:MAG: hypothetical protein BWZ10_03039 [candidate division BRC1 bacterium ADurb.BinA364]|nr:MAG: hypothetical protein BWZ10_03039 [candidate division BRC1 bacterium ADurb.BinA364]